LARLPPFLGGEESVTLTLPASVAAAALTALKQDTIDFYAEANRARAWPFMDRFWIRKAQKNERNAEIFRLAMAGRL